MTLSNLVPGETATVTSYNPTVKALRKQLLAMGLTPGTQVTVVRVAPLGDPMELKLRGFSLTLRKDHADAVNIELNSN